MLSALYGWMREILFFMVGITIIFQILSKSSYKKYAEFVAGMILIIFILRPVLGVIDKDDRFYFSLKSYEYMLESRESLAYVEDAEDLKNSAIMREYKTLIAEQTEHLLNTKGLRLLSMELELYEVYGDEEYGKIKNMYITAGYQQDAMDGHKVQDVVIEQIVVSIGEEDKKTEINVQGNSVLEINTKNMLADFYNLEASHINISIREDHNG